MSRRRRWTALAARHRLCGRAGAGAPEEVQRPPKCRSSRHRGNNVALSKNTPSGSCLCTVVLPSSKKRWMQRTRLQTTRHDIEKRLDWRMPRPPEDCWLKSGVSLLTSQSCSLAGGLQRVCARIEIIWIFLQILLARTCPRDILGPDVRFLERSWDFSRFSPHSGTGPLP